MSEELKPCCNVVYVGNEIYDTFQRWSASCIGCGKRTQHHATRAAMIKEWNATCRSELQENKSQTDLSLQEKLQSANALIDTLVEALELCHKKAARWHPCDEASIKLHAVLAEAKKWKGEV